jgi:hypothetical protein
MSTNSGRPPKTRDDSTWFEPMLHNHDFFQDGGDDDDDAAITVKAQDSTDIPLPLRQAATYEAMTRVNLRPAMFYANAQQDPIQSGWASITRSHATSGAAPNEAIVIAAHGHIVGEAKLSLTGHAPKVVVAPLQAPPVRIARMPAEGLQHWLKFFLTKRAYKSMVVPIIADEHREYFECLKNGEHRRLQWIAIRMKFRLVAGVVRAIVASVGGLIRTFTSG